MKGNNTNWLYALAVVISPAFFHPPKMLQQYVGPPNAVFKSHKWQPPQTILKCFWKRLKKIQANITEGLSHITWLKWKKIEMNCSQCKDKQHNPFDRSECHAENTDKHALSKLGISTCTSSPASLTVPASQCMCACSCFCVCAHAFVCAHAHVCVFMCVYAHMFVCEHVVNVTHLQAFVSALGSYEMGHHIITFSLRVSLLIWYMDIKPRREKQMHKQTTTKCGEITDPETTKTDILQYKISQYKVTFFFKFISADLLQLKSSLCFVAWPHASRRRQSHENLTALTWILGQVLG